MALLNSSRTGYARPLPIGVSANPATPREANLKCRAALIVGAGIGLGCGFAGLYFSTLSIFLKPMATSFGWGRADTSAVFVMSMLGSAISAPMAGRLMDRIGAVRVIGLSMLLFALSLFSMSLLKGNHLSFAVLSLVTGLVAVGTAPTGYLAVLSTVFDKRLGTALSLSMVGAGLGAISFPLLAQWLIEDRGWRAAYQALAVLALVLGGLAYGLLAFGQKGGNRGHAALRGREGDKLSAACRDRRFWILVAVIFTGTAAGLGAVIHLSALLTDRGMSMANAARLVAFPGLGLMLGRLLSGWAMDHVFAPLIAAASFALGAVGLCVIGLEPGSSTIVLAVSALLFGFALGVEGDFAAFAVRRYFGTRAFGQIYGVVYAAYALGGVAGPIAFGIAFDRAGNYSLVLIAAVVAYLLAGAAVLTLGRYRWAAR